jgi:hypothetical protein
MRTVITSVGKLLIVVTALGALSVATLAGAGQAGAAASPKSTARSTCMQHLTRNQEIVANYTWVTTRLARLNTLEAKAQAAGHTRRAAYLQKMIAHEQAVKTRMSHSKAFVRASKAIKSTSITACQGSSAAPTSA